MRYGGDSTDWLQVWPAEQPNDESYFLGAQRPAEFMTVDGRIHAFCHLESYGCRAQEMCVFGALSIGVGTGILPALVQGQGAEAFFGSNRTACLYF